MRELVASREVLAELVRRQVKLRYKQTALGVMWVFLQPLVYTAILAAVFSRIVRFETGYPYPVFVLSAFSAFMFFSRSVAEGTQSLLAERNVITKVYFPRLIVPIATLSAAAVDMLVAYLLIVPAIGIYLRSVSWSLLALPLFLAVLFLLCFGIVCITSAINALYRDVGFVVGFLLQVWIYLSPVLYPSSVFTGRWAYLAALNPLTGLLEAVRWALLPGYAFPGSALAVSVAETAIVVIVGPMVFAHFESKVADRI